jgi:hypothetical protein
LITIDLTCFNYRKYTHYLISIFNCAHKFMSTCKQ